MAVSTVRRVLGARWQLSRVPLWRCLRCKLTSPHLTCTKVSGEMDKTLHSKDKEERMVVSMVVDTSDNLRPGVCLANDSRPLQNIAKIYNARNRIYSKNSTLNFVRVPKWLWTHRCTKFQLELLIRSTASAIHKCRENILESSRNVSEKHYSFGRLVNFDPSRITHPLYVVYRRNGI